MPDPTRLEDRLALGRAELLDAIDQPPLAAIGARATARRRRRNSVRACVALAAVAGVALAVVRPWGGDPRSVPDVADAQPPGYVYTDAGITVNGLDSVNGVHQLPGRITDVEFPDIDRGYAIGCDDHGRCAIGRTTDGGLTWQSNALPAEMGTSVDLLPLPGEVLVAATGDHHAWTSSDGGLTWRRAPEPAGKVRSAGEGQLLRLGEDGVAVWAAQGFRGTLITQPGIDVRWVASRPAADGAWWVGGVERGSGRPAIAVSGDGGTSWTTTELSIGGGEQATSVQVSLLGSHAYALVLGAESSSGRSIVAVFHSANGGRTFAATRLPGAAGPPDSVTGELIPLLDGRLLIAGGDNRWYVSADDGATFAPTGGNLPTVGRLGMTPGGYLAYGLFNNDWAAYSSDGSTWRKLRTH
jgi:hypothetical protein